ncbi:MAG: 4-hydroxythreonine-4-phosphate dehydrogenase PdxA [Clostridia bacterium]|nr:4-hydroxythreonine-4-phosphate dehydrogenase PdxA [Clostridia bacterium]
MEKPIIGVTMGDPAGIGPEIVAKSFNEQSVYDVCRPVVVGDAATMEWACQVCGLDLKVNVIDKPADGKYELGTIDVIDLKNVDRNELLVGEISAHAGAAAYAYIEKSVYLALDREIDAIATTPINKESFAAAKVPFIGHTEVLAGLTNTPDPLTMFEVHGMRVFFLTRHVSLSRACELVTKERLVDYIDRCTEALRRLGVNDGTMAVAGLNPHSGEHGLFGNEEVEQIEPAIKEAREKGFDVVGPVSADSVFHLALQGRYNSVLSLYHDQGHIATKTLDFERTIAITNSLPFLRTSVDHGTALDIAGKGIASALSMTEAILLAAKYAPNFINMPVK